jgi:hypothetical protein
LKPLSLAFSGKLITRLAARHRHQEWLAFLKTIVDETPGDLAIQHHRRILRHP